LAAVTAMVFFLEVINSFTALRDQRSISSRSRLRTAGFPRITADQQQQPLVIDRPFLQLKTVLGDRMRDQMLARDFDLLILCVTGDCE